MRKFIKEYRSELTYDFRKEYGLSLYDCIFGGMSLRELWDLVNGVLSTRGTMFNAVYFDVERYSLTDLRLTAVQNSVVGGWEAKSAIRKKAMFHPRTPTTPENRKGEKRFASQSHLEKVRSRVGKVSETVVEVIKEYYHIDKLNIVRKCRKNGVDCKVSNNHYSTKDEAVEALNS